MTQIIMQVLATLVAFGVAYAGVMASEPHTCAFSWPALLAGLTAVASYHGGLFQDSPTAPGTSVTSEKVEVTKTPAPAEPVKT